MQTFLPYADFNKTAECLDFKRLGKQRVEAYQLLNILLKRTDKLGWINHPACLMWKGFENALKQYYNIILQEWISRGYRNNMKFEMIDDIIIYPFWLGDYDFHASHRSNLLRKNLNYYQQFNWNEDSSLPYIWPVKNI